MVPSFFAFKLDLYRIKFYICIDILINMKKIVLTQQEIWDATRPNVYRSKKTYRRKSKHKKIK